MIDQDWERTLGAAFAENNFPEVIKGHSVTVIQQINADLLPLFEQAGAQTGYKVAVIARAGEKYDPYTGKADPTGSPRTTILVDGSFIGISITRPSEQNDHTPFWNAYNVLKASSVAQKG